MSQAPSNLSRLRAEMRARAEATRPQLARATGLSLVTVSRLVARLVAAGELEDAGLAPSGGGRPVRLYRLCLERARAALLRIETAPGGFVLHCRLRLLDPLGREERREEARFAQLEEASLDGWLDSITRERRTLLALTIEAGSLQLPSRLLPHLRQRYGCPCQRVTIADALADPRDNTATLVIARGQAPLATMRRQGRLWPCGPLAPLRLPVTWEELDYGDHTLLEEMIARLLLILSCALAPARITLHGDFWNERLMRRIRYNATAKLKGAPPPALRFRHLRETDIDAGLARLVLAAADEAT